MEKINFKDFLIEERRVRRTITTPKGNELKIYEPSGSDIQKIYDFLLELENGDMTDSEMTAKIYPIITNISFEGLSLEMIKDIINSDAKELEDINEEIALILAEVSVYRAKRAQVEAEQAKIKMEYAVLGSKTSVAFESIKEALETIQKNAKGVDNIANRKKNEQEKKTTNTDV